MRGKIEIRSQKRVDQSTLPEREAVEASIVFQKTEAGCLLWFTDTKIFKLKPKKCHKTWSLSRAVFLNTSWII